MSDRIVFTTNYSDHSTDQGFQFEFFCSHCGTGYRTRFQAFSISQVSGALNAASSLLGGVLGKAADLGERVKSASWQKAHDEAFVKAAQEMKPDFIQCPRCSAWVCKKSCWNTKRGLCKGCAPDIAVEMAAAQASKTSQAVWENAQVSEEDNQEITNTKAWKEGVVATCPSCSAPLAKNAKFCPECGTKIKTETFCTECGAKMAAGVKFCPECGTKVAQS